MKREWKPGDVALIPFAREDIRAMFTTDGWAISDAPDVRGIGEFSDVRPLVVIDPDDREQVERLADLNERHTPDGSVSPTESTNAMQAALREFVNPTPPKLEEPTGLGAVVEDESGVLWVNQGQHVLGYLNWRSDAPNPTCAKWHGVAAVRVLSEGVAA